MEVRTLRPHERSLGQTLDEAEAGASAFASKPERQRAAAFALARQLGISAEDFDKFYGKTVDEIAFGERGSPAPSGSETRLEAGPPKDDDAEEQEDARIAREFNEHSALCRFLEATLQEQAARGAP